MARRQLQETQLEATSRALTQWRQEFGGRGRAIPDALWERAVDMARGSGVAETARALKLDRRRLEARMAMMHDGSDGASPEATFVELAGLATVPSAAPTVFEITRPDGETLRLEIARGLSAADLVALARAFWSSSP